MVWCGFGARSDFLIDVAAKGCRGCIHVRCHGFVLQDAGVYDCERSGCVVMEVAMLMARCPPWLVVVTLSQHHSNCSVELRSVCHAHDTGFVACEEVFRGVKNAMRPGPADKDGLGHDAFDLVVLFLNAALGEL